MRTGGGSEPEFDQRHTVDADTAKSALTTGRRTCADAGSSSKDIKAEASTRFNLKYSRAVRAH